MQFQQSHRESVGPGDAFVMASFQTGARQRTVVEEYFQRGVAQFKGAVEIGLPWLAVCGDSFWQAVSLGNWSVGHSGKKRVKVFPASLCCLASKKIECRQRSHLLRSGARQKLIDGIALAIDQRLNAAMERVRELHSERVHGVRAKVARNFPGVTAWRV